MAMRIGLTMRRSLMNRDRKEDDNAYLMPKTTPSGSKIHTLHANRISNLNSMWLKRVHNMGPVGAGVWGAANFLTGGLFGAIHQGVVKHLEKRNELYGTRVSSLADYQNEHARIQNKKSTFGNRYTGSREHMGDLMNLHKTYSSLTKEDMSKVSKTHSGNINEFNKNFNKLGIDILGNKTTIKNKQPGTKVEGIKGNESVLKTKSTPMVEGIKGNESVKKSTNLTKSNFSNLKKTKGLITPIGIKGNKQPSSKKGMVKD